MVGDTVFVPAWYTFWCPLPGLLDIRWADAHVRLTYDNDNNNNDFSVYGRPLCQSRCLFRQRKFRYKSVMIH